MMVYVFGIDIPLVELMLVTIAVFICVLLFSLVFILRVAKKEKDILESTRDLLESEHKIHHIAPKKVEHEVKEEGFFAKLFAAPEKPKKVMQETLTKKRNKEIFKKHTKSIFTRWNEFWDKRKLEAEKTWQQRYNVETKKALQTSVEVQAKQPKQESWWDKHQKEVARKVAEENKRKAEEEKQKAKVERERIEKERKEQDIKEAEKKKIELTHKNPMSGEWFKKRKKELAKEIAEEKEKEKSENEQRAKKHAEWKKDRQNSWWERHKREVAKRPDPEEQLDTFWKQRKVEAEQSWRPKKEIIVPQKPHKTEGWWQKHVRKAAEEKARREAEKKQSEKSAKKEIIKPFFAIAPEHVKRETWWDKHKRETARRINEEKRKQELMEQQKSAEKRRREHENEAKKQHSPFQKWNSYWNRQKTAAKSWETKKQKDVPVKQIEAPPKPHEIESWWAKHNKKVAEEKARKQIEQASQLQQKREEKKREVELKKIKVKSWWEQHKKNVAEKKIEQKTPSKEPGKRMFWQWDKYWKSQKNIAKQWRKK